MIEMQMLHMDCMDYMAGLPDGAFELAIVDPPYGIGESNGKNNTRKAAPLFGKKRNSCVAEPTYFEPKQWDRQRPPAEYFAELRRVSRNQIIWGGNYFSDLLPPSSCWIVWDKDNSGDFADAELAWTSFKTAVRKFSWRWNGMLQQDMANKETRIHPTQKPVALYKWLLVNYAKPGDRIIDTHGGSGSSCIACHDMGFDLTWMEKDKDYYTDAVKRYKQHAAQLQMF